MKIRFLFLVWTTPRRSLGRAVGLLASAVLVTSSALANDRAACLDAASKAQTFRDVHKLVEAREQLRVCAAAQCPGVVQTDCATWLAEVEQGLPTVVITAKDVAGRDRFDVKVTVDGQAPPLTLQGQALPMNPGPHALHFEADGVVLDQQILIKEGMKNQSVTVVLVRDKTGVAPAAAVSSPAESVRADRSTLEAESVRSRARSTSDDGQGSSGWRTAGWVAGGVGVAGLAVGTIFGLKAISDKNSARCDSSNACDPGPLRDANSAATIATVGIVAGGALLVGGAAVVLFTRTSERQGARSPVSLRVVPLIGARDGGLLLGGTW